MGAIAKSGAEGQVIRLSPAPMQPIASDDVVAALADVTLAAPINGATEVAGPERVGLAEIVQRYLTAIKDPRQVIADEHAPLFGMELNEQSLVPGASARIGTIRFETWLSQQRKPA